MQYEETLARVIYFAGLTAEQRADVAAEAAHRTYDSGEVIFLEAEPCAGLFIVLTGLVRIFKTSADGKEQILRYMSAGDSFNEVPVFDGGTNPASAAASEPTEVLFFSRETVLKLLERYPGLARIVVSVLGMRLRHMVTLVEDLSFRQVTGRVVQIIIQSVTPHEGVGAGVNGRSRITQQEMAEMAGTSREVVARALRALEDAGAIELSRGDIQIKDGKKLLQYS
ncbi:MAG: Crp/Fnr family transcriptional regulator [Dehalococcoidia bacterium]